MAAGEPGGVKRAVRLAHTKERLLWMLALVFFGVGDIATTGVGWHLSQIVEAGPVTSALLEQYGLVAMSVLKLVAFAACYEVWRSTPGPVRASVPFSLASLGVLVTAWNLTILAVVML